MPRRITSPTRPVPPPPTVTPSRPRTNASTDAFVTTPRTRANAVAASVPLSPAGSLYLSPSGAIVLRPDQDRPSSSIEMGEALFRAAQLAETSGENLFRSPALSLEQKRMALASLAQAFNAANPELVGSNGFETKDQALQTRASAAPLLVDLATSLDPSRPDEAELQRQIFHRYVRLLESEPHGLNRHFMIFDLDRAKAKLAVDLRPRVDELMREVAPLAPPYDEWFANGNETLNVEYYVGEGFWQEELADYERRGFARTDNPDGTVTMRKRFEHQRRLNDGTVERFETEVVLRLHDGPRGMFEKMNDPNVHLVVYSGHANYGREVPSHLLGAPEMRGTKVFMGLQCGGKGVHNALLDRYPDLHVVGTKSSSYGFEDRRTFLNTIEGIAKRLPWAQISAQNRRDNSDNYYFPMDTLISKRAVDRDGDGKVDSWDRVVNYDTFRPEAEISAQLTPKDPGVPADRLDGRALHGAILRFQRMAGYNQWLEPLKDQGVLNAGFYEGSPSDPLYRLTRVRGEDGADVYKVQVNKHYAHAGEDVLGAALHYELGRHFALERGLARADAKAVGLLMAAKALDVDTSWQDDAAWRALLRYANIPAGARLSDAMHASHADDTYPAGSRRTLELFNRSLEAAGVRLE